MMQQGLISLASLEVMFLCAQEGNDGQAERNKFIYNPFKQISREKDKTIKRNEKEIL